MQTQNQFRNMTFNEFLREFLILEMERRDIENQALDTARRQLDEIIQIRQVLAPDLPAGFTVTITPIESTLKENSIMSTATVDLQILDDGKGVRYVFTPVKKDGVTPTTLPSGVVPSYSSSNPALTVAPDPSDSTGLTCLGTITAPAADAAGIVVTIAATLPNGTALSFAAPAVDIVPDPANDNNPSGFTVQESAL